MNTVLYAGVACAAWFIFLRRVFFSLKESRNIASFVIAAVFLFIALAFTTSTPAVWVFLGQVTGVPNIALLLSQVFVMGTALSQLVVLTLWTYSFRESRLVIRRYLYMFCAVTIIIAVLFNAFSKNHERPTDFVVYYVDQQPLYAIYLVFYITAFTIAEIAVLARCIRYSRIVHDQWLIAGLRIAACGASFGLIYCLARYLDLLAIPLNLDPYQWEIAAKIGAGFGALLTLVGWSIPEWGPSIATFAQKIILIYRYHRLTPLWKELTQLYPEIILDPRLTSARGFSAWPDLKFRTHRRIIEIRDAQRILRDYMPDDAIVATAFDKHRDLLVKENKKVCIEAIQLFVGVKAYRHGLVLDHQEVRIDSYNGTNWYTEVSWLVRVSDAVSYSQGVAIVAKEIFQHLQPAKSSLVRKIDE